MSLNDPHWGRNSSDKEPKKEEQNQENQREEQQEPELRSPKTDHREEQKFNRQFGQEKDLEELWKQFNDRINSMIGGSKQNRSSDQPRQEQRKEEPRKEEDSGYDFEEPPLREGHTFNHKQENRFSEVGGTGGGNNGGRPPITFRRSGGSNALAFASVAIALIAWLASGFYIVPEGQKGVVTTFGRYSETTNAGFRWHLPYPVQDVDLVDVSSVRKAEIGMKGSSQRLREALMLTDDENIVDVMFNVQYRIQEGKGAEEFLFRTRDPMGAVVQTAESAMREVVGRKKMDSVLFESKQEIAEEVKKLMQEMLDRYHSGIQILSVAIQNAQPPEQVQAAFNDAVKAGQDRERQINEGEAYANDVVPKARGMAERLRQEAEGYKSRVVSTAEGDASRFDQVYQQYEKAPKVTRDRMYVDTMQQILNNTKKVLIDNKSSSNLLYLPLDKLMEKSAESTQPSTSMQSMTAPQVSSAAGAAEADSGTTNTTTSRPLSRTLR